MNVDVLELQSPQRKSPRLKAVDSSRAAINATARRLVTQSPALKAIQGNTCSSAGGSLPTKAGRRPSSAVNGTPARNILQFLIQLSSRIHQIFISAEIRDHLIRRSKPAASFPILKYSAGLLPNADRIEGTSATGRSSTDV